MDVYRLMVVSILMNMHAEEHFVHLTLDIIAQLSPGHCSLAQTYHTKPPPYEVLNISYNLLNMD